MIKRSVFLFILMLLFFVSFAKNRKKNADNLPLTNTKWVLKEVFNQYIYHDPDTAYIVFSDNYTFTGNLGCNIFFGNFNNSKKRFKFDYTGATKKLCQNMEVEKLFIKAIKSDITHYYIEKNKLFFVSKKKVIFTFETTESIKN